MNIICTQENLKNGLLVVSRITGNSATLPILNNVLLETENGLLKISATNLEIGISTYVRCKIEEEGSLSLNSKTFTELVTNLPNQNISIIKEDSYASITTENYQTKINHLPAEDFPIIPTIDNYVQLNLPSSVLRDAINSVIFAVSTSETQPEMSGVYIKLNNQEIIITATDRYRLAEQIITNNIIQDGELEVIVPSKTMLEVSRIIAVAESDISIKISNNQIAFVMGDTYVISRLIEGNYPDYKQIIPEHHETLISLSKKDLLNALKTSGIFSKNGGSIGLEYSSEKQKIYIKTIQSNLGESNIELDCKIDGSSGNLIMNYRYIQDMLVNTDSEKLVVSVINETQPVVFRQEDNPNYLYLVMPLKI